MISVCHKQDLNSLLAKSVESDGELLMTMLEKMGISQENPITLSIEGDNSEILGSCEIIIPEESPIIDNNQHIIPLENTVDKFLALLQKKYALLDALSKPEPSPEGTTKTTFTLVFDSPRCQISVKGGKCCDENGENCVLCH